MTGLPVSRIDLAERPVGRSYTRPSSYPFNSSMSARIARPRAWCPRLRLASSHGFGALAQLGERLICIQEVTGSIPVGSTRAPRFWRAFGERRHRIGSVAQVVRAYA